MVMRNGKYAIARDFGATSKAAKYNRSRFIAVDPGSEHVGVAEFERRTDGVWYCASAGEMTPAQFLPWYVAGLRRNLWERVVVESWRLFPESAKFYVGSDMPTSRLIGAIEALATHVPNETGWFDEPVSVIYQDPQIKVPTRSWLKRRKMRSVAKMLGVAGDHATDAELHGYRWIIQTEQRVWNATMQAQFKPSLSPGHDLW